MGIGGWAVDGVDNTQTTPSCPPPPQPLRRRCPSGASGPVFGDQMALFSIVKVQAKWAEWPCFR